MTGEPGLGFHGLVRRREPITGLVGLTTPHAFVPMVPAVTNTSSDTYNHLLWPYTSVAESLVSLQVFGH